MGNEDPTSLIEWQKKKKTQLNVKSFVCNLGILVTGFSIEATTLNRLRLDGGAVRNLFPLL